MKKYRVFSPEVRIGIAQRIANGESVTKLQNEFQIKRSVLYRWRNAYRESGVAGLQNKNGRPPGTSSPVKPISSEAEQLRHQISELERKIGQQAMHLDFFKRAFRRVKESGQPNGGAGVTASTRRSAQ